MSNIQAKRSAPAPVESVSFEGIRYEVSEMGTVLASNEENNQKLWENVIYTVSYIPFLEKDVQTVYIRKLQVINNTLLVTDERDIIHKVDLKTGKVLRPNSMMDKNY